MITGRSDRVQLLASKDGARIQACVLPREAANQLAHEFRENGWSVRVTDLSAGGAPQGRRERDIHASGTSGESNSSAAQLPA